MAMFSKDPAKVLSADLAGKVVERDRIVARLADAETAVVDATAAATQLAMSGADDTTLSKAESKILALRERVSTLRGGLATLGTTIIALENQLAAHVDQTTRRQTARECEKMADDLEEVGRDLDEPLQRMVAITSRAASAQIWDATGLHTFAENSKAQIPAAIAAVSLALRQHGTRVMDKREPRATLLTAPAPAATVAVVEPKVVKVFATKNVCWTDAQGQTRTASKYSDIDLPPATAKRALASGICREIGSDIWRAWSGSRGFSQPPITECESLDSIAEVIKLDTPVVDAQFTRIDRGGPVEVSVLRKA